MWIGRTISTNLCIQTSNFSNLCIITIVYSIVIKLLFTPTVLYIVQKKNIRIFVDKEGNKEMNRSVIQLSDQCH